MKLLGTTTPHKVFRIETDEWELGWIERGLRLLLEKYPNSDTIIDLLAEVKALQSRRDA